MYVCVYIYICIYTVSAKSIRTVEIFIKKPLFVCVEDKQ